MGKSLNFIILFGPTGSGKGDVYKKFLRAQLFGCKEINNVCLKENKYFFGSVDQYVENDAKYKKAIKRIHNQYTRGITKTLESVNSKSSLSDYVSITMVLKEKMDTLSEKMTQIYFAVRNSEGYNTANERNIALHMKKQWNILLEITGTNGSTIDKICDRSLFQTVDKDVSISNYKITVLFPFTSYKILRQRLIDRFVRQIKNKQSSRLPPTDESILYKSEKESMDNLVKLIETGCVDKLVIFDNNRKKAFTFAIIDVNNVKNTTSCDIKAKLTENPVSESFNNLITKLCPSK